VSGLRRPSVSPWHFASQGTGRRQPQRGVRRLLPEPSAMSRQVGFVGAASQVFSILSLLSDFRVLKLNGSEVLEVCA